MTKVWAVNAIYDPYVSHGYEPVAMFSTRELAEQFRDLSEDRQRQHFIDKAEYYKTSTKDEFVFTVQEWEVDPDWTNP